MASDRKRRKVPAADSYTAAANSDARAAAKHLLIDYLVGGGEQAIRYRDAKVLSSFAIDH